MSVDLNPDERGFVEARWITSSDLDAEHLLDIFTSIDADSDNVWEASKYKFRKPPRLAQTTTHCA